MGGRPSLSTGEAVRFVASDRALPSGYLAGTVFDDHKFASCTVSRSVRQTLISFTTALFSHSLAKPV